MPTELPGFRHLADEARAAVEAAEAVGPLLRRWFGRSVEEEEKEGGEPVTIADREADDRIRDLLTSWFSQDALLTEEGQDDSRRLSRRRVWIIDPLDGTRDFLEGSEEFSVHVGLAVDGAPAVGVVHRPMADVTWCGVPGEGAWRRSGSSGWAPVSVADSPELPLRVAVTRRRLGRSAQDWLERLPEHRLVRCGSSGLKATLVAEGSCDLYVATTGRMKEWDTCAPEAVVRAAGGFCCDLEGLELRYNRADPRVPSGFIAGSETLVRRVLNRQA